MPLGAVDTLLHRVRLYGPLEITGEMPYPWGALAGDLQLAAPDASRTLDLLAALSHHGALAIGSWITLLASRAGDILSRDTLLKALRGVEYDGLDRSIDVAVSRLRKKLGDDPNEPHKIKTVRNKGYLFVRAGWDA